MEEFLSFVTIDVWTLIFTWVNLFILFLLMKHFLFGRIQNVLKQREDEISKIYSDADLSKRDAENLKTEYENRIKSAKDEADEIIKKATQNASMRSDAILKDAKNEAQNILNRAQSQIETQKKKAVYEIKTDITSLAVAIAKKIVKKDISKSDHEKMINDIIKNIGDNNE